MSNAITRLVLSTLISFLFVFNAAANDSDLVNCNHAWKIAVLGSSTAYGTGASTYDSSWVGKFTSYIQRKNSNSVVYNLGIPGFTTYQNLCPTGFTPPANRPSANTSFNITAALNLHPDALIINMPSNDAANDYTLAEQQANFERAVHLADSANVPVWITTTQPRNNMSVAEMSTLIAMRDWINTRFGDKAVDFWTGIANADGSINNFYDYDYVHVNNQGHDLLYKRIKAETILDSLCARFTQTLVARAGNDQAITLPLNTVTLDGTASYSTLGGIVTGYQWQYITGPTGSQINSPSNAITTVTILTEGRYAFLLTVTDNALNIKSDTVNIIVSSRILIDFGPTVSASPDANGNYWNNVVETQPGIKLSGTVTIGNQPTNIGLQVVNRIDGTFNVSGPGTNTGNSLGDLIDYPASATSDFSFAEPSATNGQWKITGLESAKQYSIKFWGTRTVADDRIIQIKRADQTVWQEYNAAGNNNYNNAAIFTFSGKTSMSFDIRVKSGSAFGYICLIDITRTTPAVTLNVPPFARANDVTVPLPATSGTLDGSASGDDDGIVTNYQWIQSSGPAPATIVSPNAAITAINDLIEGIYTFRLTVTDDSSATAYTDVTVTVNSRVLIDFGPNGTIGADAGGKYWNNVTDGLAGIKVQNAINTGNAATSVSLEIINRIDGTFNTAGPGTNTGSISSDVGDYPNSAVADYAFAHSTATNGQWKIAGLDPTKQYTIKFWGTRDAADERVIQIKATDETNWQEYDARNNIDYNNSASFTFTGKTERIFDIRVKDNNTFGHISLMDIKITTPPVDCSPRISISTDQSAAVCYGTAISFTATAANTGSAPVYSWKKNGVVINGATTSTYSATDLNNNDSVSCAVTANTNCFYGITASSNSIAAQVLPAVVLGAINGPADVCPLIGNTAVYSVDAVQNVTLYNWAVPAGAAIVSGQGTNSITVSFTSNFGSSGIISVSGGSCSDAIPSNLTILKNMPADAGPITGPTSACSYLGNNTQATYSIAAVAYATSYIWTVPANVTIISGQGSNSINVIFSGTFTTSQILVRAVSNCYTSKDNSITVSASLTNAPGAITGPTEACSYISTPNTAIYTIQKVAGATTYLWSVPAGASIVTHPGGAGVNDTIITVSYNSNFVSGTAIAVQASGCTTSTASTLAVSKTAPATPGIISGPTEACPYIGSPNQASYTIRKVAGATSYIWTVPIGITVSSHPGGTGVNDTIINVSFSSSFVSGTAISVQAATCLTSAASSITILKTGPATPGVITGPTEACAYIGTTNQATYTVRKVAGATSYIWTVPTGITVSSHPGGAGVNDTTIKVTFSSSFVSGTAISVQASSCLTSAASSITILKTAPATPGIITGPTEACSYIGTTNQATYTVRKVAGATSYIWTVPTGITVSSHPGGTGVNDTTIKVTFSSSFVSGTAISVQASSCLTSAASSIAILKTAPATPGIISGPTDICAAIGTTATYTVRKVTGATSYIWAVPAGATISLHPAGAGVNDTIIKVSITANIVSGTAITVQASSCLASAASSLTLLKTAPAIPGVITGPTVACTYIGTSTTATYTIRKVTGATSYTWTVPTGVTVSSHPGGTGVNDTTIKVTFSSSFVGGSSISVKSATCVSSAASTLAVTRPLPAAPGAINVIVSPCIYSITSGAVGGFSVLKVAGLTYNWSGPSGSTVYHYGSTTGTSDSVYVVFPLLSSGGTISVTASNGCGASTATSVTVGIVNPSTVSLNLTGPSDPCPFMGTTTGAVYKVKKVAGIATYTWTIPSAGATVTHPNGAGENDTVIVVIYSSSFSSGSISVTANTLCGSSPAKTISLVKGQPGVPGTITATSIAACPNRKYTYSVSALPVNATYVSWTVPTGATIVSGQNTTTITVSYPSTAIAGTVAAYGKNNCGTSSAKTLSVSLAKCTTAKTGKGEQPAEITGSDELNESRIISPGITVMPNPSYGDFTLAIGGTDLQTPAVLRIYDLSNRVIETRSAIKPGQTIKLGAGYKPGIYMGEFIQGTRKIIVKLVKL